MWYGNLLNKRALVPECTMTVDTPAGGLRLSASYRGGQPRLSRSGLLWLKPTEVENKKVTEKPSSFFHRLAGRQKC